MPGAFILDQVKLFRCLMPVLVVASTSCAAATGNYFAPTAAVVCGPGVGCTKITEARIGQFLTQVVQNPVTSRQFHGPQGAVNRRDAKRLVLNGLIKETVARQHAAKMGITVTSKEVTRQVQALRKRFPTERAFQIALQSQNLSPSDLRIYLGNQMLYREIASHLTKGKDPSETELRSYYEQNKVGSYDTQARVAHILICGAPDESTRLCEPTESDRALAAELANRARSGDDFAALAKQFSKDPTSAHKGGDLGYLNSGTGSLPVEFENTAFGLNQVGQVSDPVATPLGLHIIKLLAKGKSYEDARREILRALKDESAQEVYSSWLQRNVAAAKVKVNPQFGRYDPATQTVVPLKIQIPSTRTGQDRGMPGDSQGQQGAPGGPGATGVPEAPQGQQGGGGPQPVPQQAPPQAPAAPARPAP